MTFVWDLNTTLIPRFNAHFTGAWRMTTVAGAVRARAAFQAVCHLSRPLIVGKLE